MITKIFSADELQLEEAARLMLQGEPIAFPTETVYGLGAPVFAPDTIKKIFDIKNRPQDNPLIVHLSALEDIEKVADALPTLFYRLSEHFFPGPLTVVLQKHPQVPDLVSAGRQSVAVRMPQHPIAQSFIAKVGCPLVAPSANISGKPSSTEVSHVLEDFSGKIAGVIDGGSCALGIESTVISLLDPQKPQLLRLGALELEVIEEKLSIKIHRHLPENLPLLSPGMHYRHYAPQAKILLFQTLEEVNHYITERPVMKRKFLLPSCQNLYAAFRQADREKCQEILVLLPSEETAHRTALINRLQKAMQL